MVNTNKLKAKIVENGLTVEEVANKLGKNKSTFYRKISGNGDNFTVGEIDKLIKILEISTSTEIAGIFFAQTVAY